MSTTQSQLFIVTNHNHEYWTDFLKHWSNLGSNYGFVSFKDVSDYPKAIIDVGLILVDGLREKLSEINKVIFSLDFSDTKGRPTFLMLDPNTDLKIIQGYYDVGVLDVILGEPSSYNLLAHRLFNIMRRELSRESSLRDELRGLRKETSLIEKKFQQTHLRNQQLEIAGEQEIRFRVYKSLEKLAGGIAHNLNNIMCGVAGYSNMLSREFKDNSKASRKLEIIESSVLKGSDLIQQLLNFSRQGFYIKHPANLNLLIQEASSLTFNQLFNENITVSYDLEPNLWNVNLDRNHFNKALIHLVANSLDAMNGKGHLKFSTLNVDADEGFCRFHPGLEPGPYVCLAIEDDGVGMEASVRNQVFDPFFTTKSDDPGKGFGLSNVHGILSGHGGTVMVYSQPGFGTVFHLYFPAIKDEIYQTANEEQKFAPHENPVHYLKGRTILVVDDQEDIAELVREFFIHEDIKILSALSGQEAIEIFKEQKDQIDLILLDVVMPQMDGLETFKNLKSIKADVKVLFSSGFSHRAEVNQLSQSRDVHFLGKPYTAPVLTKHLASLVQ